MKIAGNHYDKGSTVPLAAEQKWHLNQKFICWIWGSRDSDFEEYRPHHVVQSSTFQKEISVPSTGSKSRPNKKPAEAQLAAWFCWFLSWLTVGPEERGDMFLCSVGLSPEYLSFTTQEDLLFKVQLVFSILQSQVEHIDP
jgi:hypothetical protein